MDTNKNIYLCLMCANLITDVEGTLIKCNNCGYISSREEQDSLRRHAQDVFTYGYLYKKQYEAQVRDHGEVKSYFHLAEAGAFAEIILIPVLKFISASVLAGISYDLSKKVFKKIIHKFKELIEEDVYGSVYFDESIDFDYLCESAEAFYSRFQKLDKRVRSAIMEEIYAHAPEKMDIKEIQEKFNSIEEYTNHFIDSGAVEQEIENIFESRPRSLDAMKYKKLWEKID